MVIHDESELVVKLPMIRKPLFEAKSLVNPNNFEEVYENMNENEPPVSVPIKKSRKIDENESEVQVRIPRKKLKKTVQKSEDSDNVKNINKISVDDLEELRTVYTKCKSIIRRIEARYGHLLHLDEPILSKKLNETANSTDDEETVCQCKLNKKIVFDDDGKQIASETASTDHICPKKSRYQTEIHPLNNDLQIEYHDQSIELPNSLQELKIILQNPEIELTYRNQVIQKVRLIKQEFQNEIKFNKHSIIEKIKDNVDEMIDFKGANLSTLPGYV